MRGLVILNRGIGATSQASHLSSFVCSRISNMKFVSIFTLALVALLGVASASRRRDRRDRCPRYDVKVIEGTSRDARGLNRTVIDYQNLLGDPNNMNAPGPLDRGRREINWDAPGVPFDMPGNFFKVNVPRGAEFFTRGNEFRVSNPVDEGIRDNRFDSINRDASRDFETFSPRRLFTSLESNVMDVDFTVPTRGDDATVSGFGAVFTDVDLRDTTFLNYFDINGCPIFSLRILDRRDGLSFGGIKVLKKDGRDVRAPIAKVVIVLGNRPITDRNGDRRGGDIVVCDDFIYGEPQPLR